MKTIDIVFDGPPGAESGRFVEVERDGVSIKLGEWVKRGDYWVLRIPDPETPATELTPEAQEVIKTACDSDAAAHVWWDRRQCAANAERGQLEEKQMADLLCAQARADLERANLASHDAVRAYLKSEGRGIDAQGTYLVPTSMHPRRADLQHRRPRSGLHPSQRERWDSQGAAGA